MDYSLAKELKEAGFPQEEGLSWKRFISFTGFDSIDEAKNPTLTELIEACIKLERDGDFHLEAMYGGFGAGTCFQKNPESWELGSTPETAVARLWLALNKK